MSKQYVVTGGAGFIGTNLCEALVKNGDEVIVVDDLSAGRKDRLPNEVQFIEKDIRDTKALCEIFNDANVVVHLAALPSVPYSIENPLESHDVNLNGTLSVLDAAREAKVKKIVFAASSAAYGDQDVDCLHESLSVSPQSPYALHKLVGEQYMKLYGQLFKLQTVSLRFFNVYGKHMDPEGPYASVIGRFLKQAKAGEELTITGDGTQTRDFIHVDDVVNAIIAAAEADSLEPGLISNVGGGTCISINDLARLISNKRRYIEARIEPRNSLADVSLSKKVFDWEPKVGIKVGIEQMKKDWGLD